MIWREITIGSFLKERKERIKPDQANSLGLKRIEKIDFSGNIYLANNTKTRTNMILVKPGDLVISGINVSKGALAVYEGTEDVLATIHYSSYEFDKSVIDIEYLKWFLTSNIFINILKEQVGGGIKTELKPKKFLPLKIKLPDINLQREIAKKINNVSNEIKALKEANEENYELISKLRQSILQDAVQGKLVPQDPDDEPASVLLEKIKEEKERLIKEKKIKKQKPLPPITEDEIPYELPKGWEWVRLINIAKVIEYGTSSKASNVNIGVPVLRMNNIQNGKIVFSDLKYVSNNIKDLPRLYLKKSDLLFNRTNSYELVGKTGVYLKEDDVFTFASYLIRISLFNEFIDARFINYYMNSLIYRQTQIEPEITQQNGQANYNGTKLKNTIMPIPPLNEQKRIVQKVDQLMALCNELEMNIEQSKKDSELLMQSVLQEAFKES